MEFLAHIDNNTIKIPFDVKATFNIPRGSIFLQVNIEDLSFCVKLIRDSNDNHFIPIPLNILNKLIVEKTYLIKVILINHQPNWQKITPANDFISQLCLRKSKRNFLNQTLPKSMLDNILLAANKAPSAHNRRPQRYLIIENKELLDKIKILNKHAWMISDASVVIAVLGDHLIEDNYEFLINDCSASIQNILLASHSLGLGAVWIGVSKSLNWYQNLHQLLAIENHLIISGLIAIGYSDENKVEEFMIDENAIKYIK